MIELEHSSEPRELGDYRRKHPGNSWTDPSGDSDGDSDFSMMRNAVRHQLNIEQEGLCVYCESLLDKDDGHIEHIKPRNTDPNLTFAYSNLAHSCNGRGHCGHYKANRTIPIEPLTGSNQFYFLSEVDGSLEPAIGLSDDEAKQAIDTRDILGLNVPTLSWQRHRFAISVRALPASDREEFIAVNPFRWTLRRL